MTAKDAPQLLRTPDVVHHICSYLTKPALARLRLVSRDLAEIALPYLYKSILVETDVPSVNRFINIAKTPKLRKLVRDLTLDTRLLDFNYHWNDGYTPPRKFIESLPFVRGYQNVTALHVHFCEYCGETEDPSRGGFGIEETFKMRYHIIDTILHCLAGMWTKKRQLKIDELAGYLIESDEKKNIGGKASDEKANVGDISDEEDAPFKYDDEDLGISDQPIPIKELTVSCLADYHDNRLYSSEAWKKVISSPHLTDLKFFMIQETCEGSPESEIFIPEKYEFFGRLSSGWLSRDLAEHLQVLSLFYRQYWGWLPNPDFKRIKLPKLKILALGNYVLTHEWEIEWFASLGKENGSGGLEELYLDDCPILCKARQLVPLIKTDTCSPGYPDPKRVMNHDPYNPKEFDFALRWHQVLSHWAESMKGLKRFRSGHGDWSMRPVPSYPEDLTAKGNLYEGHPTEKLRHRMENNIHRVFYGGISAEEEPVYRGSIGEDFLYGHGIREVNQHGEVYRMPYIEYDIGTGSAWLEVATRRSEWHGRDFGPGEETHAKDDDAFDKLQAIIAARVAAEKR